jgi:hypothetical protein
VLDTLPVRTMVCICITGYQGNAAIRCTPVPTCPPGRGLILNERDECVCPPGHYVDADGYCVRCPTELGFVLVGGRCICDTAKGLVPSPDGKACVCPPGMELGPGGGVLLCSLFVRVPVPYCVHQCCGSMKFLYGSVEGNFHHFSKIKSHKEVTRK